MTTGVIAATDIVAPKLKIAIVGDTGIGKSWLACSIASPENPTIDLDFDGRAASLAGKPNVYVKTYVDANQNQPNAIMNLESDLNEWEYNQTKGSLFFKTFVLDGATYMRKALEREIIRQQPQLSRTIKIGSVSSIKIGQGYDIFSSNLAFFENLISRLAALGNLIVTFHEKNEKDETKTTPDKKAFTGMVTVDPQHLAPVLSTFNDVWRLTSNYASRRVLITGLTSEFIGKTTLKGIEKEEYDPDISKLLAKDSAARSNGSGAAANASSSTSSSTTTK